MYKLFAIILFVILQATNSIAQNTLKGVVLDSTSKEKIQYASVALIDNNTQKPVQFVKSNETGNFVINKIVNGNYKLSISLIGYKKFIINRIEINSDVDLGSIFIVNEAQTTDVVVVKAKQSLIKEEVDRTIYNAASDPSNKGADAAEVLRKVPMLSVDLDGNVSMRGSQNVKVLINNKPSTITAGSIADALRQIPADQIKSVEVITSPSSKYDSEGSAGIININLKKSNLEGYSMNLDAAAGYRMSSLGLNAAYRKGKMGFSLGGHGRAVYNVPGSFDNTQITNSSDTTIITNTQSANTQNQRYFGAYTFGWDYDINPRNSINSSVKYSFKNIFLEQNDLKTNTLKDNPNNDVSMNSLRNTNTKDLSNTIDASLNYTRTFEKPQKEFSLMALYSLNNRNNDFYSYRIDTLSGLKNLNNSDNQEITIQADYQTPIDSNQSVEMGVKNISRIVTSDYQYLKSDAGAPYVLDTNSRFSNSFNYNQNVTASYLSYSLNFLKTYSIKAGARYEYTAIDAAFGRDSSAKIPAYSVLVPSINLSKRLQNGNTIKASFTRRIQRPSLQFLNPNVQLTNPLNITVGNPTLSPEYSNNYELAYSTTVKGANISISTFVRNTRDAIQSVRELSGNQVKTTYKNIGSEDAYGINLFANIRLLNNKLNLNGGTDIFYAVLKNNVSNPIYAASNEGLVAGYRANASYKLPRDWSIQLFGFYRGRTVQLQGFGGGFGIYTIGLKKEFSNKKASLGFGFDNLFTPSFEVKGQLKSPIINQNSTTVYHNMGLKVTFTYNFGSMGGNDKPKTKKSVNNDDLKKENDNMENGGSGAQGGQGKGGPVQSKPSTPPTTK